MLMFNLFIFQTEEENITNIKKFVDNKVINIEKTIQETLPSMKYVPPKKEACICELCTCG